MHVWNRVTPKTHANPCFSTCEYRFSVSANVLDTNPIGFSEPSEYLWDNTVPIPCDDALQAKTMGFLGSKCTRTCDDNKSPFEALKESLSCLPHFHWVDLCNN